MRGSGIDYVFDNGNGHGVTGDGYGNGRFYGYINGNGDGRRYGYCTDSGGGYGDGIGYGNGGGNGGGCGDGCGKNPAERISALEALL